MARKEEEIHVVMLPWSAFGHMIPFLELSIALSKSGIHVSFLSTPKNIQRLPPNFLSKLLHLVPLPMPRIDNTLLPEGAEATTDVPADKIQYLKVAYDLLQTPVRNFVAENKPNWLIVDFAPHWAVDIAHDFNIPIIRYHIVSATSAFFFNTPRFPIYDGEHLNLSLPDDCTDFPSKLPIRDGGKISSPESWTVPPDGVDFPSKLAYKKHEADVIHPGFHGNNASGIPDGERVAKIIRACKAIAVRTCPEIESDSLKSLAKITEKPVFPVGFLLPERSKTVTDEELWSKLFEWLDEKKERTVLYIGFGSECKLNKEQVHEIAHGVEMSGLPFIWALRVPDLAGEILPSGFRDRTMGRGVVHIGWAPQREILGHSSIGGCLFHGGWGTVIETLQYGHCLVLLPFVIDQPLNARWLVEKGLGIEVERSEDGSFSRNDIAKALTTAMVLEEGEEVRVRCRQAGDGVFGDEKINDFYLGEFVAYLKNDAHEVGV